MTKAVTVEEILKTKRGDSFLIDPRNVQIEEDFNVREDYGDLTWLEDNIVSEGQLEAICVYKVRGEEKYIVVDGHRRTRAIKNAIAKGADIPYIKAYLFTGSNEDREWLMYLTGVGKKALTNLEEGEFFKRQQKNGYDVKDISVRATKSMAHVYNMLKLANAPMAVKIRIKAGEISGNTVVTIIRDNKDITDEQLIGLIDEAVNNAETVVSETGETVKKAATARHAGVMSPMKKLEKALALIVENEADYANGKLLQELVSKLNNKSCKEQAIANLFI